jgi:regulator of cell morphogenesis and NO signaling
MNFATTMTVGELASKWPQSLRILEEYGIDYCCGSGKSIAEASASAGVSMDELLAAIEQSSEPAICGKDYSTLNQRDLVDHILGTHHVFTREELSRLDALLRKVVSVHGARHPELLSIQSTFRQLRDDLMPHLLKEENVLFPYIVRLETASLQGVPYGTPPFPTVQNPVRTMMLEHDAAGDILRELRRLSANYAVPADGCASYKALYTAMEGFEKDLHQHIHLENNMLFPRAIETELELAGHNLGGRRVS